MIIIKEALDIEYDEIDDTVEVTEIRIGPYVIYPKMDKEFLTYIEEQCEADVQALIRQHEEDKAESRYHDAMYCAFGY